MAGYMFLPTSSHCSLFSSDICIDPLVHITSAISIWQYIKLLIHVSAVVLLVRLVYLTHKKKKSRVMELSRTATGVVLLQLSTVVHDEVVSYQSEVERAIQEARTQLTESFNMIKSDRSVLDAWYQHQVIHNCCGLHSFRDFQKIDIELPDTCTCRHADSPYCVAFATDTDGSTKEEGDTKVYMNIRSCYMQAVEAVHHTYKGASPQHRLVVLFACLVEIIVVFCVLMSISTQKMS